MQLVAEIHQGFEALPALRTILAQLNLSLAYNRVDHDKLFAIFEELHIPPVYARFYFGFLSNRTFRVQCGNALSRTA